MSSAGPGVARGVGGPRNESDTSGGGAGSVPGTGAAAAGGGAVGGGAAGEGAGAGCFGSSGKLALDCAADGDASATTVANTPIPTDRRTIPTS
jgi:hypothetical protein